MREGGIERQVGEHGVFKHRRGPAASSSRAIARYLPVWRASSRSKPDGNEVPDERYVALVDGTPGAYGVVVPDLPGCMSGGATVEEALRNAVEAVTLWVEDTRADGEKIPTARAAEMLRDDPEVVRHSPKVACLHTH